MKIHIKTVNVLRQTDHINWITASNRECFNSFLFLFYEK